MGSRFVKQPNGLIAVFSGVVDHLTWTDIASVIEIADVLIERDLSIRHADETATMALKATKKDWKEVLSTIRMIHGKEEAERINQQCSAPAPTPFDMQKKPSTYAPYARIEELEAEVARLRAALEQIAGLSAEELVDRGQSIASEALDTKGV